MKKFVIITILFAAFVSSTSTANANACKGDALHATPPVPINPAIEGNAARGRE